ncbi:putative diguanylate cyclase YegE [Hartmannibacter diazotrophicus]|uniref:histidine kinase n=1 Tax=Hartmannibacter diazotrophicus TaxID=1482074 RepID=A0A2C9D4S7_9HYPH|nr:PAS domain-containing protein [Hartmannibacter diazotrophicus]SON54505.1 putative diguanylate cyclase YegE [Hartmannibacter diazotrophicus]
MNSESRSPDRSPALGPVALAAALYFFTAYASIAVSRLPGSIAVIWIANALTLALALWPGERRRPAIILAAICGGILANLATGTDLLTSVVLMLCNGTEIVLAVLISDVCLRRWKPQDEPLDFIRMLALLVSVPILPGAIAASAFLSRPAFEGLATIVEMWWLGSAMGMIAIAPMAILYRGIAPTAQDTRGSRRLEAILLILAMPVLAIASLALFDYPLVVVGLALVIIAVRLPPFDTAMAAGLAVFTVSAVGALAANLIKADGGVHVMTLDVTAALAVVPAIYISMVLRHLQRERDSATTNEYFARRIIESSPIGMAIVSLDGALLSGNDALASMLGYSRDELSTLTVRDITLPNDWPASADMFAKAKTGAMGNYSVEKRHVRKDGTNFWTLLTVAVLEKGPGGVPCMISQFEDIDLRRRYERDLRDQEERWHFALEAAGQGVWDANLATGKTYYSPTWCSMLGYSSQEIGDDIDRWLTLIHPDDREAALTADQNHIAGETPYFESQFRMRHKDGRWIWILDRGRVIEQDRDGNPMRMIGIHTDITKPKADQEEMARLKDRIELAVDAGGVGIWEWTPATGSIGWDWRTHQIFGTTPETIRNDLVDWADRLHPADADAVMEGLDEALRQSDSWQAEFRILTPAREERHIRASGRIIRNADGSPDMLVGTNLDITEQRKRALELREANERLNQFASIASHDMQAPLRHIALNSEMLLAELGGKASPEASESLRILIDRSRHLQQLVKSLLAYSRAGDQVKLEPVDLNATLARAIDILGTDIAASGCRIVRGDLPTVRGDRILLTQVFQNLISNAIKFRGQADPVIEIGSEIHGDRAYVRISDNGIGIDDTYKDYIFEVFKRIPTSDKRPGTGIGLALCRRIMTAMKGDIWLHPKIDEGSCFMFKLPLADAAE